ncbi:MAG: nitroreductase family protein [bacterium JZ-2024 1]
MNQLREMLLNRRTVRKYLREPIPENDLHFLLSVARKAPTDATGQMYSFVRVTDESLRASIARMCGEQTHIVSAPEFFVVCADVSRLKALLEHRGRAFGMKPRVALHFAIVDATVSASYFACAAELLGYGVCFIGAVANQIEELCRLLLLPRGVLPVFGLTLGKPDPTEEPRNVPRLPQELVVVENVYPRLQSGDLDKAYRAMASAGSRGDWIDILERYFGAGGVMEHREEGLARALYLQGFA